MNAVWVAAWNALPIELINRSIGRIPKVIELIVEQKSDNDFHA